MMGSSRLDYLAGYELPRLARISPNLIVASFSLMKLLPARFMLERAVERREVVTGGHIVETTSGTFGLALALLAAVKGYRLSLITADSLIDLPLQQRLSALGAQVQIVPDADHTGAQHTRLARLQAVRAELPQSWWPRQYDNVDNPHAYARLAELLVTEFGTIDCLVGPVGSGGSMCGTGTFLRMLFPEMRAIAVDTHRSVLFGHVAGPRLLRGLGNSILPRNLDHTIFDEVHWVGALQAFGATHRLYREHGIFAGPTSGAAILVAGWYARQHPHQLTVAILPDEGYRYQNTVYNEAWLSTLPGWPVPQVARPEELQRVEPYDEGSWTRLNWRRRSLETGSVD
ncbi:cysteine synthase family protein (plasmid) [Bosea vestrisii]|uniref:cysteine synthase family protein n=1 Tax=Bosea vestrisii TaxID=151416 RepID=UPI0024DF4E89|nr:cysteine synthase family protein [Bosea vestrisii]WID99744.1 cysteine synthase family protein [Bosea vestrisii]